MKRLLSIVSVVLLCLVMCMGLSACEQPAVTVTSETDINSSFAGSRTVGIVYPLSANIDVLRDKLVENSPAADIEGADFTYAGVEENGYRFELRLTFPNKTKYEEIVSALIGRSADVFLSQKNTTLTKGIRMAEDFDVSELISWVERDTDSEKETRNLRFDYPGCTVKIANQDYQTGSTVSINDCKGSPLNSISVKTSNDKEGSFDRTFTFTVPNETYNHDKQAIEQYFLANTSPDAKYSGWSSEGANMVYTVIYEGLDLDKLTEFTSMLLDTDSVEVFYGDKDNASTPLSEGKAFEESLDTFSFIGPDEGYPAFEYSYSLPTSTTHGDGSVFENGRWVSSGVWEEGVYKMSADTGAVKVRIPDGVQYSINGINFYLTSLGDSRFRRTTEFLYSKTDGYDGMKYASDYFASKGAVNETGENDDDLYCRVICEGSADEITPQLVNLFGSGNFMAYRRNEGILALTVKTELLDNVNLGYMLNAGNANRPMTYYVSSDGGENIVSISVDGSETAYAEHSASSLPIQNGVASVEYRGNIPIVSNIVIYLLIGVSLLGLTAVICVMLVRPKRRRRPAPDPLNNPEAYLDTSTGVQPEGFDDEMPQDDPENSDEDTPSLAQTTTFSIFELNALSRNKKYVDEINKDIEERIQQDNLENRKNDIRAKQLEDLSRKVYGTSDSDAAPETEPAAQESQDPQTMPAPEAQQEDSSDV